MPGRVHFILEGKFLVNKEQRILMIQSAAIHPLVLNTASKVTIHQSELDW